MFMMTIMMILSTASARTLSSLLDDVRMLGYGNLVICVTGDAVGDKTFTAEYIVKHGNLMSPFSFNGKDYCAIFIQFWRGPDVYITFFLDGKPVHGGRYQQNFSLLAAGDIHTKDPRAVTEKAHTDFPGGDKPGYVRIKSLEGVIF